MTRSRRVFSGSENAAIVRRHLVDKVPNSDLCDEYGLQSTQCCVWQKQLFENGAAAFKRPSANRGQQEQAKDRKIEALEAKIQQKNEVVAELLEEHVQLKKAIGER